MDTASEKQLLLARGGHGGSAVTDSNTETGWVWEPCLAPPDSAGAVQAEHVEAAVLYHHSPSRSLVPQAPASHHALVGHPVWPLHAVVAAAAAARSKVPVSRHAAKRPDASDRGAHRPWTLPWTTERRRSTRAAVAAASTGTNLRPSTTDHGMAARVSVGQSPPFFTPRPSFIAARRGPQTIANPVSPPTAAGSRQRRPGGGRLRRLMGARSVVRRRRLPR